MGNKTGVVIPVPAGRGAARCGAARAAAWVLLCPSAPRPAPPRGATGDRTVTTPTLPATATLAVE